MVAINKSAIAVLSTSFSRSPVLRAELESLGLPVQFNPVGRNMQQAEIVRFLNDTGATIAVVGLERMDQEVLHACPKLRLIAKYGVGTDNLDHDAMAKQGVRLGWTGGVNRRSVSELVLAFALGHLRNVTPSVLLMRQGTWEKDGGRQLSDCTVGIVGLGHIGVDLAMLLKGFGCKILYRDIVDKTSIAQPLGLMARSYDELLREADVISFHVPCTNDTKGMFGRRELGLVKNTALVINTARGEIVDLNAACQAVADGKLGGYAADVFPEEPVDLSEWSKCSTLYFTPHIGGNAQEAVLAMGRSAIQHVREYLRSGI